MCSGVLFSAKLIRSDQVPAGLLLYGDRYRTTNTVSGRDILPRRGVHNNTMCRRSLLPRKVLATQLVSGWILLFRKHGDPNQMPGRIFLSRRCDDRIAVSGRILLSGRCRYTGRMLTRQHVPVDSTVVTNTVPRGIVFLQQGETVYAVHGPATWHRVWVDRWVLYARV